MVTSRTSRGLGSCQGLPAASAFLRATVPLFLLMFLLLLPSMRIPTTVLPMTVEPWIRPGLLVLPLRFPFPTSRSLRSSIWPSFTVPKRLPTWVRTAVRAGIRSSILRPSIWPWPLWPSSFLPTRIWTAGVRLGLPSAIQTGLPRTWRRSLVG